MIYSLASSDKRTGRFTFSNSICFSTAANTIGVTHTTVAVATDNVPLPKKVATFLPSDISPPTEKYWYSRRGYKRGDKKSLNSALPDSTIFYQYDDLHPDTEVDEVPLVGADGTKVKAVTIHEVPTSMVADVAKVKAATVCPSNHQRLKFSKLIQDREFYIFVVTDSLFRVPTKDQEQTP
ncbi:hypothetical protein D5086_032650 [Populus alba]|uniref:Uncharacterized protein n=1 Tax=Populus alba TaxID=43335 RepID=A0ACC4AEL9_POPAL